MGAACCIPSKALSSASSGCDKFAPFPFVRFIKYMRAIFILSVCCVLVAGCAGGPPKDYYNPIVSDPPKFKGPLSIEAVDDWDAEKKKAIENGYMLIGTSIYQGSQPKRVEIEAQAKRAHATKVIYRVGTPASGSWEVHVGLMNGGHGGGSEVRIAYLGK